VYRWQLHALISVRTQRPDGRTLNNWISIANIFAKPLELQKEEKRSCAYLQK
jgi:hypothetical protein